ncbi:hypothetical protein ES319_1Z160000v1 [Gossypium barbadense]|uniref:Calcium uniporter protein C-terminal domain-containing protein n=1 Tax=Gossypium barbadense TaxID=3634 RepID=A0A5J5NC42_GOSBA|nr:hypothetical protein ES319_1Z160000v1 [Gossypium barbadense]
MPLALAPEDDPIKDELKRLLEQKEDIDVQAHKEVRRILWTGLGLAVGQVGLFFRLTFWEFSWDVMEPITYFFHQHYYSYMLCLLPVHFKRSHIPRSDEEAFSLQAEKIVIEP